jgi:CRP/FNR family transcriptional regulator, anaerobic regulatory protein
MTINQSVVNVASNQISCANCRLSRFCWPSGLERSVAESLHRLIHRGRPLPGGTQLFRQGAALTSLYVVMVGSVKNYVIESDGTEQIVSFNLPGEILGLDALGQKRYTSTAETLESTVVCELPYAKLDELCETVPSLRLDLVRRLAGILVREHTLLLGIAQRDAEARLAMFLLSLSDRMRSRGLSPNEFNLSMTRRDIANYLALSSETVSRLLTRFQQARLASVNYKHIKIHNLERLQSMAKRGTAWRESGTERAVLRKAGPSVEDFPLNGLPCTHAPMPVTALAS